MRVATQLLHYLAEHLRELADPRLFGASVTRVEMTDDLGLARVFVRLGVGAEDDRDGRRQLLSGLASAAGRLRGGVGRALGLRYTPDIRFHYDEGPDATARVEELLAEIRHESDGER
jgi:ribosome-binding factor A